MKALRALGLLSGLATAVPASAHDIWRQPVVVDAAVWVNPGVYVSQYSGVRRNYPYVGCCLSARENWSLSRPYFAAAGMPPVSVARTYVPRQHVVAEPPAAVDRLHYPGGRPAERFR